MDFHAKAPITYEQFLESCRSELSEQDFAMIKAASLDYDGEPVGRNALFDNWLRFYRGLRNELAWFRAQEFNKDPYDHMRGDRHVESVIVDIIAEASKSANPLVAERALDRVKWQKLEELLQGHYFDLEVLIVYAIKLQILDKYRKINSSEGPEKFTEYKILTTNKIEEILK